MKRSDHIPSELLRILGDSAYSHDTSLVDGPACGNFLSKIEGVLSEQKANPIRIHGQRVQSMFAYVAAALGKCKLILEEDAGMFFSECEGINRPDFRIVTSEGTEFLVEVKNHYEKNPPQPFRIKQAYLESLTRYAAIMGIPLKFAIYWSRWNTWTLIDSSVLKCPESKDFRLTFPVAMKNNEMSAIGDSLIGTVSPLSLRLYADTSKARDIGHSGETNFTIERISLHAGLEEILDAEEKQIAWFLMHYGEWNKFTKTAKISDGKLDFCEIAIAPETPSENQGFDTIGYLSGMVSNRYKNATSDNGQITSFTPKVDASKLGVRIPENYQGNVLHLWRFHITPTSEDDGQN
ncbi:MULTISPECIES: hypothetical protein [Ereboglobus]|uniref:hypothetical protein n=1 Tax=Ereboglobus TaxID=2028344 RepID=UPI001260177F|nr:MULTISPECIES: hypothetical protein [Ereboglobus]